MTKDEVLSAFRRSGALLEGHFRLSSGLHSPGYLQCALVLQHPREAEALGDVAGDGSVSRFTTAGATPRPSVSWRYASDVCAMRMCERPSAW